MPRNMSTTLPESPIRSLQKNLFSFCRPVSFLPEKGAAKPSRGDSWGESSVTTVVAGRGPLTRIVCSPVSAESSAEMTNHVHLLVWRAANYRRSSLPAHGGGKPDESELAAIRRSNATGLPYGAAGWVKRLAKRLNLDLTIRPRGRPRKEIQQTK